MPTQAMYYAPCTVVTPRNLLGAISQQPPPLAICRGLPHAESARHGPAWCGLRDATGGLTEAYKAQPPTSGQVTLSHASQCGSACRSISANLQTNHASHMSFREAWTHQEALRTVGQREGRQRARRKRMPQHVQDQAPFHALHAVRLLRRAASRLSAGTRDVPGGTLERRARRQSRAPLIALAETPCMFLLEKMFLHLSPCPLVPHRGRIRHWNVSAWCAPGWRWRPCGSAT